MRGAASVAWHVRVLVAMLCAVLVASCGLVVSFDDYDSSAFRSVGGSLEGLAPRTTLTLTLNTPDPKDGLRVTSDGPFVFPEQLRDGERYEVRAFAPDGQACSVERGAGAVGRISVADIAVRCASSDASLEHLSVSTGELYPAFDAAIDAEKKPYALRMTTFVPVAPSVTATARAAGATIRVNRVDVASGVPSAPIPAVPGVTAIDIEVTAPDRAVSATPTIRHYTLVVSTHSTYLKASNTVTDGELGAVAISGDTLAVGAFGDPSGASGINGDQADRSKPNAGAVYVFTRTAGQWSQQAYIKASNPQANTSFGYAVALSGDTLAVGSFLERSGATGINGDEADTSTENAGAVYVFTRTAGQWSKQAYIKASNTRVGAYFGISVALSGDTLAVGSSSEASKGTGVNGPLQADVSAQNAGAAYVFTRAAGQWSQQAYVKPSNTRQDTFFGNAVALAQDTLVVGSFHESSAAKGISSNAALDVLAPGAGAVYVFERKGTLWSQAAYLKASNTRPDAQFGFAVALSGNTLAVGSYYESSKATGVGGDPSDTSLIRAGAAYVFSRSASSWSQEAYLKASNTRANARFGGALALSGNILVVGSPFESSRATGVDGDESDMSAPGAGAAYVFARSAGVWSAGAYLKASNTRPGAYFGSSLALSPDTLAVGSPSESSAATGVDGDQASAAAPNAGAVYLFR